MVGLIILSIVGLSAMILPLWLSGCTHEWEIQDTIHDKYTIKYKNINRTKDIHNIIYVQKCKKCGKLNHHTVRQ